MKVVCPQCGSDQLNTHQKGFSGKKAVAGALLTGGIGIFAGTIGSKKVLCTCLACGNTFKAGQGRVIYEAGDPPIKTHEEVAKDRLIEIKKRNAEIKKTPAYKILKVIAIIVFSLLLIGIIGTLIGGK